MENALKNTLIAKKYGLSLKSFFKDYFKYGGDDIYLIPFEHILHVKKYIFDYIKNSCSDDFICLKLQSCHGHQFLQFIELMYQFQRYFVLKKKVYFRYFMFSNFELTSDATMTLKPTKIKSWRVTGVFEQELNRLTYSERLSFLKFKK